MNFVNYWKFFKFLLENKMDNHDTTGGTNQFIRPTTEEDFLHKFNRIINQKRVNAR